MMNSNIKNKRQQKQNWLTEQINYAIENTEYILSKLEVHPNAFGNAVVELSNSSYTVRFVQDRGDIYMDKRKNNSTIWTDQCLMFDHSETIGDNYDTLIKAIKQIVR